MNLLARESSCDCLKGEALSVQARASTKVKCPYSLEGNEWKEGHDL